MVLRPSGAIETYIQPSGRSNGLSFDNNGNLWACSDERNEFWLVNKDKKVTVIPFMYKEKQLNGPNDLWIAADGGTFFTDPYYQRPWWKHTLMPQDLQGVYYISPDKKTITRIIDDLNQPNGIVGSPDGKTLFVVAIGANKTWKYTIDKNGSVSNKLLFCDLGSDGMTIAVEGNIYLTGNGVTVFDKNGKKIGNIPVPEDWTANVCFGDIDLKSLFITASKSIYRVKVKGTRV